MAASTPTYEQLVDLARGGTDLPAPDVAARIRRDAGVTQEVLAEALGVHVQTLSQWERGEAVPSGDRRVRYGVFLREAAAHQQRRRHMNGNPFGLSSPVSYDPPATVCGRTRIEERDLIDLLETLREAGPEGLTIVVSERGITRYGDPNEELYDRATFLDHRGLVTREPHEVYDGDEIVKATLTLTITPKGEAALEQATALVGAAA